MTYVLLTCLGISHKGGKLKSSLPTFPVCRYVLVISSGSGGEGSMNYMTTCGETQ